jgi:hypothetical protein
MEVYNDFRNWAVENVSKGKKIPDRIQVRSYIEKIYGVYVAAVGWKGFKIKV